jgi:hypothetical protein
MREVRPVTAVTAESACGALSPYGGWITPFIGDSEAMDKQPGQRQCDG